MSVASLAADRTNTNTIEIFHAGSGSDLSGEEPKKEVASWVIVCIEVEVWYGKDQVVEERELRQGLLEECECKREATEEDVKEPGEAVLSSEMRVGWGTDRIGSLPLGYVGGKGFKEVNHSALLVSAQLCAGPGPQVVRGCILDALGGSRLHSRRARWFEAAF